MPFPRRGLLRRALLLAAGLALAFAPAGCATASLWRDNRTHEYEAVPGVRAFLRPGDAHAFVIALDEPAVAQLLARAPACAAAAWLEVRLPAAAAREEVLAHHTVELWLLHEADAPPTWFLGQRSLPQKLAPPTAPTRQACTVTPLPSEPSSLGAALENVAVADVVVLDDGTSLAVRVAATPLTVALDGTFVAVGVVGVAAAIVLSPIGLLMKGMETVCKGSNGP